MVGFIVVVASKIIFSKTSTLADTVHCWRRVEGCSVVRQFLLQLD